MARPEKKDVDYFPFYVKDGRTLFILESKYGCKGTGFFTNVMRFLCQTPDHYYQLKDETDRLYFFSRVHCDEESGMDMLSIMSKTGKIDAGLWVSGAVIVSQDLLHSISDAYRKRNNKIITIEQIKEKVVSGINNEVSSADNSQESDISGVSNTQSKVNKSKVNNIKRNNKEKDFIFNRPNWIPVETWTQFEAMRIKIKKPLTPYAAYLITLELQKIKEKHNHDPVEVLNQSIKNSYQDVYPLKNGGNNGNGSRPNYTGSKPEVAKKTGNAQSDGQPWPEDRTY